ncbi:MAG: hypothetical protein ACRESY_09690 [Steroidobacteraceae bacterium]
MHQSPPPDQVEARRNDSSMPLISAMLGLLAIAAFVAALFIVGGPTS